MRTPAIVISCFIFASCSKSTNTSGTKTDTTGTTRSTTSDTTIYIAGNNGTNPVLWKKGIPDTLSPTTGSASQVTVSGSDVYVAGVFQENQLNGQYGYWKNGVENDLSVNGARNGNTTYTTTSIFLNGSDVYVAGYTSTFVSPSSPYLDSAVYWKNGVEINLNSSGRANSIFVQETTR